MIFVVQLSAAVRVAAAGIDAQLTVASIGKLSLKIGVLESTVNVKVC